MFMEWIKKKTNRMFLSVSIALLAMFITAGDVYPASYKAPVMAWWGTLYPGFCFSKLPGESESDSPDGEEDAVLQRKISFWLAKALNW